MSQRLNKARYAVHGDWRPAAQHAIPTYDETGDEDAAIITVQVADILEKHSGHVWRSGTYKVTLTNVPGMKSKTFNGETAWSDAARYASDAATKCGDWRWIPDL
jgi:hypothetical protein